MRSLNVNVLGNFVFYVLVTTAMALSVCEDFWVSSGIVAIKGIVSCYSFYLQQALFSV